VRTQSLKRFPRSRSRAHLCKPAERSTRSAKKWDFIFPLFSPHCTATGRKSSDFQNRPFENRKGTRFFAAQQYGWARQKLPRRWSRPPKTELWADFRVQTVEIGVFWRFGTVAVASFANVATMGAVRRRIRQIRQPHPPISENIHVV
jgi:hypothetical protein